MPKVINTVLDIINSSDGAGVFSSVSECHKDTEECDASTIAGLYA